MTDPRIDTIRKALIRGRDSFPFGAGPEEAFVEALEALDEVEGRMMPELPEGWFLKRLQQGERAERQPKVQWSATVMNDKIFLFGFGNDPRAALIAAIAKIEDQTTEKP